jgi:hypothetical protein
MKRVLHAGLLGLTLGAITATSSPAATLWSTRESYLGPGTFYGPGAFTAKQELFPIRIEGMIWTTERDFVTPFVNNGGAAPNVPAEQAFRGPVDGRLSNGLRINENAETYPTNIAGLDLLVAVVDGGPHAGQQLAVTSENGEVVMTMDLALDMGTGEKGVVVLPLYGTTGSLVVPPSLQTQQGGRGIDQAGDLVAGTTIRGRIGDFNRDGWIDGTLVAVGTLPLDSPFFPGQPFAFARHFETDMPIEGETFGNVERLIAAAARRQ